MTIEMSDLIGDAEITDDITLLQFFKTHTRCVWGGTGIFSRMVYKTRIFFESTGVKPAYMSPSLVDRNKYGMGVGSSWNPSPKWTFDAGLFGAFMGEWKNTNSQNRQLAVTVDPFGDEGAKVVDGRPVSDGVYRSSKWADSLYTPFWTISIGGNKTSTKYTSSALLKVSILYVILAVSQAYRICKGSIGICQRCTRESVWTLFLSREFSSQ